MCVAIVLMEWSGMLPKSTRVSLRWRNVQSLQMRDWSNFKHKIQIKCVSTGIKNKHDVRARDIDSFQFPPLPRGIETP